MIADTVVLSSQLAGATGAAVSLLKRGQAVAFPTDTVYGIGVDALNPDAVNSLYEAKGRPESKAIPVLISSASDLESIASYVPDIAYRLTDAFWPGALTIVVPSSPVIPKEVTAGGRTVAARAPQHTFTLDLLRQLERPLATSSANLSGESTPTTAEEVLKQLGGRIPLIVDGGPCPGGIPSTVVDASIEPIRILRVGAISFDQLASVVPNIVSPIERNRE